MADTKKPETPAEKSMRLAEAAQAHRRAQQAKRGPVDPTFAHLKAAAAEEPKKGGRRRRNTKRSRKSRKTRKSLGGRRR